MKDNIVQNVSSEVAELTACLAAFSVPFATFPFKLNLHLERIKHRVIDFASKAKQVASFDRRTPGPAAGTVSIRLSN
jgi:hypothetical protein